MPVSEPSYTRHCITSWRADVVREGRRRRLLARRCRELVDGKIPLPDIEHCQFWHTSYCPADVRIQVEIGCRALLAEGSP
jgi:hypothetical protein